MIKLTTILLITLILVQNSYNIELYQYERTIDTPTSFQTDLGSKIQDKIVLTFFKDLETIDLASKTFYSTSKLKKPSGTQNQQTIYAMDETKRSIKDREKQLKEGHDIAIKACQEKDKKQTKESCEKDSKRVRRNQLGLKMPYDMNCSDDPYLFLNCNYDGNEKSYFWCATFGRNRGRCIHIRKKDGTVLDEQKVLTNINDLVAMKDFPNHSESDGSLEINFDDRAIRKCKDLTCENWKPYLADEFKCSNNSETVRTCFNKPKDMKRTCVFKIEKMKWDCNTYKYDTVAKKQMELAFQADLDDPEDIVPKFH